MSKTVMTTGASSGFGLLTTKTLLKEGHKVVGTMRDVTGRNKDVATELGGWVLRLSKWT
jgi:NADP-dependent 3-hydroxy acid dehydrogenase YdfG